MANDEFEQGAIEVGVLSLFPPAIRQSVLEDKSFLDRSGLRVDATIRFDQAGIGFRRSQLFQAVRGLFSGELSSAELHDTEGRQWNIAFDERLRIHVKREDQKLVIPDFTCLSFDSTQRLAWFDHETTKFRVTDSRMDQWRAILQAREIEDEEVDPLLSEFRLTPSYVAGALVHQLQRQTISVKSLVPSDPRYYDRLVGGSPTGVGLKDYFNSVAAPQIKRLLQQDLLAGLKDAFLLSSHPFGPQAVALREVPRQTVFEFFQWLEVSGDRFSQIGGIECGLACVDTFPELEPCLIRLIRLLVSDEPDDKVGRLNLLCSLIVLVEGELAHTGICRNRSPYWRRLASIAHASLLERAVISIDVPRSDFNAWAMQNRGLLYYLQTFADMRLEPRWHPDFVLPGQLHAEFVGRIAAAAHPNLAKVNNAELRGLLDGDEHSVRSKINFPFSFLPGPLEGGVKSIAEMPSEIETDLRANLDEDELTPKSFASLVNSALIYRVGPLLAQLAAEGLRRVKYQLRHVESKDEAFSLLSGLATVASVTKSADLADEVRVLTRVVRRKAGIDISQTNAMRIALVAAAAHADIAKWCKFVGDCVTEFAFEDMILDEASALRHSIHVLRDLEPHLWATTARADAAISAFVDSSAAQVSHA